MTLISTHDSIQLGDHNKFIHYRDDVVEDQKEEKRETVCPTRSDTIFAVARACSVIDVGGGGVAALGLFVLLGVSSCSSLLLAPPLLPSTFLTLGIVGAAGVVGGV